MIGIVCDTTIEDKLPSSGAVKLSISTASTIEKQIA
jgi:hypothetical protein